MSDGPMDRSDHRTSKSYGRTNILPMVKRRNCKALDSSLEARGFASMANVRWSDRSIESIGQAILRSDKYFTDGEMT